MRAETDNRVDDVDGGRVDGGRMDDRSCLQRVFGVSFACSAERPCSCPEPGIPSYFDVRAIKIGAAQQSRVKSCAFSAAQAIHSCAPPFSSTS